MSINEEYMSNIRKVNKSLKSKIENKLELQILKKYKADLIAAYGEKITQKCNHKICIDDGYFKLKGKDVWLTEQQEADFRFVHCEKCGQEIYLIKNDNEFWDTSLGTTNIEVKSKRLCKRM